MFHAGSRHMNPLYHLATMQSSLALQMKTFFFFIGTILADEDDQASGLPQQAFSLSGWLRRPIRGGDRTTAGADGRGAEISG